MTAMTTSPAALAQTIREGVAQHAQADARYRAELASIARQIDPTRADEVNAAFEAGVAALTEWHRTLLAAADVLAAL